MIAPQSLAASFEQYFGRAPAAAACAPGRVNLIGEHVDYAGGCVLPLAIQLGVTACAAPGTAAVTRLISRSYPETPLICVPDSPAPHLRLAARIQRYIGLHGAYDIVVDSDLPLGQGLSSSAAFELAVAGALLACAGPEAAQLAALSLARACQRAEQEALGTRCGLLDQLASLFGQAGQALLLDCRDASFEYLPFPGDKLRILLIDSQEPRELAARGYNARRRELEEGLDFVGLRGGSDGAEQIEESHAAEPQRGLRLVTELEAISAPRRHWRDVSQAEALSLAAALPPVLQRRVNHVVTEQARVLAFAQALREGDIPMLVLNLGLSHASLRHGYEVSTPRIDAIVEALGKLEGSRGARIHGGGFGGSVLALFEAGADLAVLESLVEQGLVPHLSFIEVEPASGALIWPLDAGLDAVGRQLATWLPLEDLRPAAEAQEELQPLEFPQ